MEEVKHAMDIWVTYYSKGRPYCFCWCGYTIWDDKQKCPRNHEKGILVDKTRKRR